MMDSFLNTNISNMKTSLGDAYITNDLIDGNNNCVHFIMN